MFDFSNLPPLAQAGAFHEPHGVHAIIETPMGSRNKYNFNEEVGLFQFSRTLRAGMMWPCDFGFVPQTLAGDGDALDVALLGEAPTFPGCLIRVRVIGAIGLIKNGEENNRILAVPARSTKAASRFDEITDLSHMNARHIREVEAFLSDYNTFEGHQIELTGWRDADAAWQMVLDSMQK